MRIGSIDYSSKATKLIAALMVCVLVFMLAIPAQPAEAVAGTTVALAAGLTLAFVAACGVAFTVNEAQNSQSYWEGQIDSYLADSGLSDVGEWVDFGSVIYDSASGKLCYPGAVISGFLDFFGWFTEKNGIEAGRSVSVNTSFGYVVDDNGVILNLGFSNGSGTLSSDHTYFHGDVWFDGLNIPDGLLFAGNAISISVYDSSENQFKIRGPDWWSFYTSPIVSFVNFNNSLYLLITSDGNTYCKNFFRTGTYSLTNSATSLTATASDVVGLPDLEEKETELGYVPDINIPLPETVAADTNIGDINDAADAVLDYAGTAGNTLDLEYEYVEDTNVDTGTDTGTGEGTQEGTGTDAETGTQTGSVALENVAADSLVEVAPETMLEDDTLMGLFISKFPWCIPFDLYFAISAFAADPVAPEFEVNLFEGVSWEGLDLSGTEMTLSFEAFEKVAAVTRWSTLIVFCAGLAMITKRMIWS